MCVESIDVRKRVLRLVHDAAVAKAAGALYSRHEISEAVNDWIDELAKKHQPDKCIKCGHSMT